jgi:hypothetical protein
MNSRSGGARERARHHGHAAREAMEALLGLLDALAVHALGE